MMFCGVYEGVLKRLHFFKKGADNKVFHIKFFVTTRSTGTLRIIVIDTFVNHFSLQIFKIIFS